MRGVNTSGGWQLGRRRLLLSDSPPFVAESPTPAAAVTATGLIWSRYSTQINPVNYNLLAVNLFMFL